MHLDGEVIFGEKKLQQQGKALRIARGCATRSEPNSLSSRRVCVYSGPFATTHLSPVEPGFSDALVEFVIGIYDGKIERAPWRRVEGGLHQEWVELGHAGREMNKHRVS